MLGPYELSVFLAAAEAENFSTAARQLNLTQPAVSMQVRALEKKLGITLFHRVGRSLTLTEHGAALIPLARDLVRHSTQLQEEIEALKGEVTGQLSIGCSTTTGKYYLPMLVARFQHKFPRVSVNILNRSRESVLKKLCDGVVHLSVVSAQPDCSTAMYSHFFDDHVVLVVNPKHPWARQDTITPEMMRDAKFILREPGSGTREEVERALLTSSILPDELNVVMEIGNSEAIAIAVEEGIGAAFVSRVVAQRGIDAGRLTEVQVEGLSLQRKIYITQSKRHPATRAQAEFWNFVHKPETVALLQGISGINIPAPAP